MTQAQAGSGAIVITDLSASGAATLSLGTGTGSGNVTISGVNTGGAFTLTGDQASDVSLQGLATSAGLTVNIGGSGFITTSALDTAGALSITKTLGNAETAVLGAISGFHIHNIGCRVRAYER